MSSRSSLASRLSRQALNPAAMMAVSAFFLVATFSLSMSAQNTQSQGEWFTTLLVVNIAGIAVLLVFLLASLIRLVRQYRKRVLGSRLMVRFVVLFFILTIIPISVVFYFSAQFLTRGVDSWFDDKIEQALDDALLLGQGFLEASKQNIIDNARSDARRIVSASNDGDVVRLLEDIRRQRGYTELDLFASNGRIIASSNVDAVSLFPDSPAKTELNKAAGGEVVVKLEPMKDGALQYRVLHPVVDSGFAQKFRILQMIEPLPLRYSRLGNSLEQASSEYNRLSFLRGPLKISFLLTLSLITLMTTLISISLALYAARRLVAPINDLATGTRAVAEGDYSTQLPIKSEDELGLLVASFNSMITQVRRAQDDAQANHLKEQNQRAYLQSVLSNLSSGVLSFDDAQALQTHNSRASAILGTDLDQYNKQTLLELSLNHPDLKEFCDHLTEVMDNGRTGEQEISLDSAQGKQLLMVRTSTLSIKDQITSGWVVVFDDVTNLVTAERDAAWGEVARRLAHEIKNPLTPIGLSAERIRRKYLHKLPESEREALDRSTRTIAEQVQTLKRMVDAFASYARSERLDLRDVDLNRLIEDVVDLYRQALNPIEFSLSLEGTLNLMRLDQDGLRQILNNIIGNACDALNQTPDARILITSKLEVQQEISGVSIVIQDNGPGFEKHIIDKVFEPYVTNKLDGTGLGMAIVKRIAQAHGGFVIVSNQDQGGGRVKVWLPEPNQTDTSINTWRHHAPK
jgi:nitrogen fixation/metabolism regulation signal transduction histidine kinase